MHSHMILKNSEFLTSLETRLPTSKFSVLLISAFLRSEVLLWAAQLIPKQVDVSIVTRWRLEDLKLGASDLTAFEVAKENGWKFYLDQKLHAKAVLCDHEALFLGSANLTCRGTHLSGFGNNEISVLLTPTSEEVKKINEFLTSATYLTRPLFLEMQKVLGNINSIDESKVQSWPTEISECLNVPVERLWVDECLWSSPSVFFSRGHCEPAYLHDLEIFGSCNPKALDFLDSRVGRWLSKLILESSGSLSFGYVSARLHNSFINDPTPFRRQVKDLVFNIFEWVKYFELFPVKKWSRSESIMCNYAESRE